MFIIHKKVLASEFLQLSTGEKFMVLKLHAAIQIDCWPHLWSSRTVGVTPEHSQELSLNTTGYAK